MDDANSNLDWELVSHIEEELVGMLDIFHRSSLSPSSSSQTFTTQQGVLGEHISGAIGEAESRLPHLDGRAQLLMKRVISNLERVSDLVENSIDAVSSESWWSEVEKYHDEIMEDLSAIENQPDTQQKLLNFSAHVEVGIEPVWIARDNENAASFDALREALDDLYRWLSQSNVHPAEKERILAALVSLKSMTDHKGVWNWAAIYSGELLERAAKEAVYEVAKSKFVGVLSGLGAVVGIFLGNMAT
ncbi:MAG: hypothetical protein AB7I04_01815 [Pseudomonadales bacterium]